jgi:hypothetical protein
LEEKDHEKKQIQDIYENEMKNKLEENNFNIFILENKHNENIRKLHKEFEEKNFFENKKYEEEKSELMEKIMNLEKELILSYEKSDKFQKAEIFGFQKKYLAEMINLQTSFKDFKIKTYNELKSLKKQKEEAIKIANNYEQEIEMINYECKQNENIYKENSINLINKLDSFKIFIKNNEILKGQLELSKSEIAFLKLKINKLENSEKSLQDILLEKNEGFSMHQNHINNNLTLTDGFYNIEKGINYINPNSNRSEYNYCNYDNINLVPHIQSPNPFSSRACKIVNKNINKNYKYTDFTYENLDIDKDINDINVNNLNKNIQFIKKRSNSKSIMKNNTSKKKLLK